MSFFFSVEVRLWTTAACKLNALKLACVLSIFIQINLCLVPLYSNPATDPFINPERLLRPNEKPVMRVIFQIFTVPGFHHLVLTFFFAECCRSSAICTLSCCSLLFISLEQFTLTASRMWEVLYSTKGLLSIRSTRSSPPSSRATRPSGPMSLTEAGAPVPACSTISMTSRSICLTVTSSLPVVRWRGPRGPSAEERPHCGGSRWCHPFSVWLVSLKGKKSASKKKNKKAKARNRKKKRSKKKGEGVSEERGEGFP